VDAWPGLDAAIRTRLEDLGGQWQEVRRAVVPLDARVPTYESVLVEAGSCVDAVVVPDDDVAGLDLEWLDASGRSVARSRDGSGARALTVCSANEQGTSLIIRPHTGRGFSALGLHRAASDAFRQIAEHSDLVWLTSREDVTAAAHALDGVLSRHDYPPASRLGGGNAALGRHAIVSFETNPPDDSCQRIDVVAGKPLSLVDASLWSDAGVLLAAAEAPSSAVLFACAHAPARLEVVAKGDPGPFVVVARLNPWKDRALRSHPRAAARMLAEIGVGLERLLVGKEKWVKSLSLDAQRRATFVELVPAGKCERIAVGTEGPGTGVDLAALDEDGVEVDRAEGARSARVVVCAAADKDRQFRIEARASAGSVDAVAGARLE
jgi:hypothetical protein